MNGSKFALVGASLLLAAVFFGCLGEAQATPTPTPAPTATPQATFEVTVSPVTPTPVPTAEPTAEPTANATATPQPTPQMIEGAHCSDGTASGECNPVSLYYCNNPPLPPIIDCAKCGCPAGTSCDAELKICR